MFLVAVHLLSWLSIACSLFTIDYLELLGIKQVLLYVQYGCSTVLVSGVSKMSHSPSPSPSL